MQIKKYIQNARSIQFWQDVILSLLWIGIISSLLFLIGIELETIFYFLPKIKVKVLILICGLFGGYILFWLIQYFRAESDQIHSYKIETYCKNEIDQLDKDIDKYIKKSQSIMKKNEKIFKKKEDYIINELKKKKNDTARRYARKIEEFEEFISKKLKHERDVKKISSRRFELYFRDAKKGLEKFIQLNRKLEDKLDLVNYNEFALETLKVSSKGGVGPEFMPKESKKLFESVKKFMKAAKKQGV